MQRHQEHVTKLEQVATENTAGQGACSTPPAEAILLSAAWCLLRVGRFAPGACCMLALPPCTTIPAPSYPLACLLQVLRLLENDQVTSEEVEGALRDGIEYYLASSTETGERRRKQGAGAAGFGAACVGDSR